MKKQFVKLTAVVAVFALAACGKPPKPEADIQAEMALKEKVMVLHDSAMVHTDDLFSFKKHLIIVKTDGSEKKNLTSTDKTDAENLILDLQKADDAMNNWMAAWKEPDYTKVPHDSVMMYLNDQLTQITSIDVQIDSVVSKAKVLVDKYPQREEKEEKPKDKKDKKGKKEKPLSKKERMRKDKGMYSNFR